MPLATLPLGLQDAQMPIAELYARADSIGAQYVRIITTPNAELEPLRDRMRDAAAQGLRVILTVGGVGTTAPRPGVAATLRLVHHLPRAAAYTWTNEPDLVRGGRTACEYGRAWRTLRRHLGRRLWFGDTSPWYTVSWTLAARRCAHLHGTVDLAAHPYDHLDGVKPYTVGLRYGLDRAQAALPNLPRAARRLRAVGLRVRWRLTEYGLTAAESWRWSASLAMARAAGARVLVVYTACGPTWCTRSYPR